MLDNIKNKIDFEKITHRTVIRIGTTNFRVTYIDDTSNSLAFCNSAIGGGTGNAFTIMHQISSSFSNVAWMTTMNPSGITSQNMLNETMGSAGYVRIYYC